MIKLIKSTFHREEETKASLIKFIGPAKQLSFGPECKKFEINFSKYQGRKYCVFFNSGSSANLALIQSLLNLGRLQKKDLIGFSALTWATNVMPLIQLDLKPIPIDIELETLNISSKNLNKILEKYPLKALFITNLLGFCDDLEKIKKICDSKKIILLEDNCEALGTVYKGKKLGNFGLASTFSFYVGHHMSTIEGGMVCTDDAELNVMLRIVRNHGLDRHLSLGDQEALRKKHNLDDFYARYTFYTHGYNLRPTEITGFLGLNQLNYINDILNNRNANFLKFASAVNKNYFMPIRHKHIDFVSNFAFPLICKSRSALQKCVNSFEKRNIEIRPIVSGNMLYQLFMKDYFPLLERIDLPNAEKIHNLGFYFGNNPDLTEEEVQFVIDTISTVV